MNAFVIDAFEFCRLQERREGESAVSELERLAQETANKSGSIRWSLQGGVDKFEYAQLTLSVSGTVQLMCQRCMTPFAFDIASVSRLVVARDEENADEIDEMLADDTIDVIVGSKLLNFVELIEDEALLAIPQSPKHEVCPDQVTLDALASVKKPSPFAVLKDLKH